MHAGQHLSFDFGVFLLKGSLELHDFSEISFGPKNHHVFLSKSQQLFFDCGRTDGTFYPLISKFPGIFPACLLQEFPGATS